MQPLRNFISDTISSVYPDSLSRMYNNLWGSYSNTHMRKLPGNAGWEITGYAIKYTGYFASLLMCTSAPQSPLIHLDKSWNDILKANQLCAWFDKDESGFPIVRILPHDPNNPECQLGLIIPIDAELCLCSDILVTPSELQDDF